MWVGQEVTWGTHNYVRGHLGTRGDTWGQVGTFRRPMKTPEGNVGTQPEVAVVACGHVGGPGGLLGDP